MLTGPLKPDASVRPVAIAVVRNGFVHDARVLRAVGTLHEAGFRSLVVAALTAPGQQEQEVREGVEVVRIRASAPIRWVQRRFNVSASVARPGHADSGERGAARIRTRLVLRAFRGLRTLDWYWHASRAVLDRAPTLVHCNDHNTMWIGVAAKAFAKSRVLYDAHELWPDRNGRWEWRPWLLVTEALFTRVADEVVVASPGFVQPMMRRYRISAPRVVRNVPARAAPTPRGEDAACEAPVAVYVGALLPGRGLEQAIDAVALVPGLRLRLIGHGGTSSIAEMLLERARAAAIQDRFELLAPVAPDEVVAALSGATVGLSLFQPICLSHELTLPNKLFEYVAAGLPVLTSDVALSAAFVRRQEIGEVVPATDPAAIARGLSILLDPTRLAALRPRIERTAREHCWERERLNLLDAYASAAR
jgi:glycosyltransferase involved in cell wall biosynthesis